jgi:hypothetical protein
MTLESRVSCRKSKIKFAVSGLAPFYINHWVWNGIPVARTWGTKLLHNMLKYRSLFTVSLKKIDRSSLWLDMVTHTVILDAWCTFLWITRPKSHIFFINHTIQWKCTSSGNHTLLILNYSKPFSKCHCLMFVLNCKFRLHCHFIRMQIQIIFQYLLLRSFGYT